jgi:hypothetical protein
MKPMSTLCFLLTSWVFAQQLPVHHLHLLEISEENGTLKLGDSQRITQNEVYQNQPEFLANGDILFTAFDPENSQTDIMRYRIADGSMSKVLSTPLSEYSPTLMPDGRHFSVVRVEQDNSQRLVQVSLGSGQESPLIPKASRIGYHAWLEDRKVALFIVAPNPRLLIYKMDEDDFDDVFDRVGRCIKQVPDSDYFSAVYKPREGEWVVRAVKGAGEAIEDWFATLPNSEDYVWYDRKRMLMARQGAVYLFDLDQRSKGWALLRDYSDAGLTSITRMALSQDRKRLVMVNGGQ